MQKSRTLRRLGFIDGMMVRDDDVDAQFLRFLQCLMRAHAVVHGDEQSILPLGSQLHRVRVKSVSLAEAVRDVKAAFDAEAPQRIHHDRRRADAIRIIVAADHHLFLACLGNADTRSDFSHALCSKWITEDGRLKQCVQIFLRKIMCCQHPGAQPAQLMTPHELLFPHGIDFGNLHSFLLITQRRQFPACVLG